MSTITTDHEKIKQWITERDGRPARVKGTGASDNGIIRVDFGAPEEDLEEISWEEFFDIFESKNLAFLYEDTTAEGRESHFFKFIDRNTVEE